ncbi:hypothetical protein ACKAV7_008062 [Fusarium commune]|nr:hypothetical protein LZL87_003525 [Fusarium oxysporum]
MDLCIHRIAWGLFGLCSFAFGHSSHHHHLHQHHNDLKDRGNPNVSNPESIVANALAALSGVNKARVENPSFNKLCGESLRSWYDTVAAACERYTIGDSVPMLLGGYMWAAYNETCLKSESGDYCDDVIAKFTRVSHYTKMPLKEMCSTCYVKRFATMQSSPYSLYNEAFKEQLEYIYSKCGLKGPTQIPASVSPDQEDTSFDCGTDEWYTTSDAKETCNSVALKHSVSSAALFNANQYRLSNCNVRTTIGAGTKLCIPPTCPRTYILRPDENCFSIEYNRTNQLRFGDVQLYNPWVGFDCIDLQPLTFVYGTVLCFGPQFGQYNSSTNVTDTTTPQVQDPYTYDKIAPPKGAKVPKGTTERCGGWHVADKADSCARIFAPVGIHIDLFLEVNTDLGDAQKCSDNLAVGNAYCVRPNYDWKVPFPVRTEVTTTYYFTYDTREPTRAA